MGYSFLNVVSAALETIFSHIPPNSICQYLWTFGMDKGWPMCDILWMWMSFRPLALTADDRENVIFMADK